ncbi:hypothetical protein EDD15DRAFT_2373210 [Pisolithus albus]|nr:hypothetical protein EDD15DRAFT_2373210 [Pisolithus albus]
MTTLMDALISYYESTPTSVPQGTEASFAATSTPTAPILDISPLLHSSSGSHLDPGAPTVPQGTEVSSPNDPAPDPLSLPLNTVGMASTPGTTFIPVESIFDTSPPPSFILLGITVRPWRTYIRARLPAYTGNLEKLVLSSSYKTSGRWYSSIQT